jgi:uroporphyrinogen decarboxylase
VNTRERFQKIMHWREPDRVPNMEFGYWEETIRRWHGQGLPADVTTNSDVEAYLGLEGYCGLPLVPARNGLFPPFEKTILEVKEDRRIIRDEEGNIVEAFLSDTSMPHYIRFGLETMADWERYKQERLDPSSEGRVGDVREAAQSAHAKGLPILIEAGSLYGWLRNWMGLEGLSIALMTESDWVEKMMDHLVELTLSLIAKALPGITVDAAKWWEDMCYNKGPLLSPRLFSELMVPRYKAITAALRKYGIDVNILDCDGRIDELVPGWLEAGISCMFPIEAAHTDPWRLRREYGERVLLFGGVNKLALIQGKMSIDRELARLQPLVELGGYIPCLDHRVPPDVSLDHYLYYLEKKKEIL